jgi:ketosteroid isomerase-like protein
MSQARIELIKAAYAAVGDRRFEEWASRNLPAEIEWHPAPESPDYEIRRGPSAVAEYFDQVLENAVVWDPQVVGVIEQGTGTLVVSAAATAESRQGVSLEVTFSQVWDFVGERPVRVREFLQHSQALEAAGLRE